MTDLITKCEEYFDTSDFYEVLKVKNTATTKEIKKAYYKLSLLVHPDRVEDHQKSNATEKFKILGKIHTILQDTDKRKIYDEQGTAEDEDSDSSFNWMNYWRSMFKKITTEDIENYKKEYIGSETERIDIKKAYVGSKGDMDHVLEMVAFSTCDDEPRIMSIVQDMVDADEVETYEKFFKEPKVKKLKRKRKFEKEKRESEKLNISDQDLAMQIQEQHAKREKNMQNFLDNLEAKYGAQEKRKALKKGDAEPKVKRVTRSRK